MLPAEHDFQETTVTNTHRILAPGAISVRSVSGSATAAPADGPVLFGRNRGAVQVCVGEDDLDVSREHGVLTHKSGAWWVTNLGQTPIRLPKSRMLHPKTEPIPLAAGYTSLFLHGSRRREHLLELYVAGPEGGRLPLLPTAVTRPPRTWQLSEEERLILVVMGQKYLLNELHPQPLPYQVVAGQLAELSPVKRAASTIETMVRKVRLQLSEAGVTGLLREEVDEPVGNALNDNLLKELVWSTTLGPSDLDLLG
jgi:hypothetical protein